MVVTKRTISQILQIEESDEWDIFDSIEEKGLYLVHPHRGYEDNWPDLHGVIVDVERKMLVCRSFRFSSLAVADSLKADENGIVTVLDKKGFNHHFLPKKYSIKDAFDGVVLRVFKHDDVVYFSSHKKIDASNSRWVDTDSFVEMYKRGGGPDVEMIFSPQASFSPWVYTFIVVDPDILVASRQNVQHTYVVYTGAESVWDLQNPPVDQKISGVFDLEPMEIPSEDYIPEKIEGPGCYRADTISLEQANENLTYGFAGMQTYDQRLSSGEAVMLYAHDANGKITDIVKVMSTSFNWRTEMRSNTHSVYHQLVLLASKTNLDWKGKDELGSYKDAFPLIPFLNKDRILKQFQNGFVDDRAIQSILGTNKPKNKLANNKARLVNLQFCFLFSLPLSFQKAGVEAIKRYSRDKQAVVKFIISVMDQKEQKQEGDSERTWKRIAKIAADAKNTRLNRYNEHLSARARKINQIKYFIGREYGTSLYKMISLLRQREKRAKHLLEQQQKEQNENIEEKN